VVGEPEPPPRAPATPPPAEPPWNLYLILPSLKVTKVEGIPNPFRSEYIQICSGGDPALKRLVGNIGDRTMTELQARFSSHHGDRYLPACLLIRTDAPDAIRSGDAISAFRNTCCVVTVTFAVHYAIKRDESGQWMQAHSDHFLLCPELALKDGKGVWKVGAIVSGYDDEIHRYHGHPSYLIETPEHFRLSADAVLLDRLLRVWRAVFEGGNESPATRRLFRALEVAFHAARYPSVSIGTTINDVGTRIGLWVSAFEILCRVADDENVTKAAVLANLARTEWRTGSPLRKKAFKAFINRDRGTEAVTFVEKVYDEIYAARNDFMHGNPVTNENLKLKCVPDDGLLAAFAPLLFNLALRNFLAQEFPGEPSEDELMRDGLFYFGDIEETLCAAMGEPRVPPPGVKAEMLPPPES
jgi:hypothetical protein